MASNKGEAARLETPGEVSDASQDKDFRSDSIGYKRPPKATRFAPGQSGNPRGRPRGVKSLSDIVRKIAGQTMTITENGRRRRVPWLEGVLLRSAVEALRGDQRQLRLLLPLFERYGETPQGPAASEKTT